MKAIILSGISGSGKTTFLRALEDAGYFCVDNFPLILLQKFLELCGLTGDKTMRCAFVVDIREREFFDEGKEILKNIKDKYGAELIFLESPDDILLKRFRETRRSHPLYNASNIKDALKEERELVKWIRNIADKIIDTSQFTPHELRRFVLNTYSQDEKRMKINLMSFGYAYGIPLEADMVLDVRFLPNPFFIEELKEKTGLSDEVREYIKSNEVYKGYFHLLLDFLVYLIPLFEKEGKSYLTTCFGCTGGKHRSVFIVKELAGQLSMMNYNVSTLHRDIDR
jgi:UPF0042 nucleotide-binding protein